MRPFRLTLFLMLALSVLPLAAPARAETAPANAPRPLNLSLPRDVLDAPGAHLGDEAVQRNLRAPASGGRDAAAQPRLPYGAGWEQRQQDMGGTAAGAPHGGGAASPAAGAGRRGR